MTLLDLCPSRGRPFIPGVPESTLSGSSSILFYSILFYSILFYSILFYSILIQEHEYM